MIQIDSDIRAINRRIDAIFRKYGGDSAVYKEATKFLRGGDAPETYKSSTGALHLKRGKSAVRRSNQIKGIRRNLPSEKEIKEVAKSVMPKKIGEKTRLSNDYIDDTFERYQKAKENLASVIAQFPSDPDELAEYPDEVQDAFDVLHQDHKSYGDIISAYEILRDNI